MQKLITLLCLLIASTSFAQKAELVYKGSYTPASESAYFDCLEPTIDSASLQYVATLKVVGSAKKADFSTMFASIAKLGQKLGANCFKLQSFTKDKQNKPTLILRTFYTSDTVLYQNF